MAAIKDRAAYIEPIHPNSYRSSTGRNGKITGVRMRVVNRLTGEEMPFYTVEWPDGTSDNVPLNLVGEYYAIVSNWRTRRLK